MNLLIFFFCLLFLALLCLAAKGYLYYIHEKRAPVEFRPEDAALAYENVSFKALDGSTLSGWFIACPNSEKTVVCTHGFSMNKGDALKRTHFLAKNYNLFYFDFRGAGESAGRTKTGYSEPDDIAAAANWLQQNKAAQAQKIAFYGISQGAGALVRYAAEQPQQVSGLILEAVYFSFKDVARRWIWRRAKTPYFPAVYLFLRIKSHGLPADIDQFAPKHTAARVKAPVLLIHGALDRISPIKNAKRVYERLNGPKELWSAPTARHTSCSKYEPEEYKRRILAFLEKYL